MQKPQTRALDVSAILAFVERTFTHETLDDARLVADTCWRIICRILDREDLLSESDSDKSTRGLALDAAVAQHPEWVVTMTEGDHEEEKD